jgi:hypothetical protein
VDLHPDKVDMRGHGVVGKDIDIKAIGREEIIAMFEGQE